MSSTPIKKNFEISANKNMVLEFPDGAQLISSSLGKNNQILLRYYFKSRTFLLVINLKTREITSKISLVKGSDWSIR